MNNSNIYWLNKAFVASFAILAFATWEVTAIAAAPECRTAALPDGTPAMFCKDKKGNWKQQEGKVEVAPVADSADAIPVKADAVFQGTYEYVEKITPKKRRARGFGDILNAGIDDALNTQTFKGAGGLTITLKFDGNLVTGSDTGDATWGKNAYTGFVRNGICELSSAQGIGHHVITGPCNANGFSGTIKGVTGGGYNFTGKFDTVATKFDDNSKRDAERAALQKKCDEGSNAACVELDQK